MVVREFRSVDVLLNQVFLSLVFVMSKFGGVASCTKARKCVRSVKMPTLVLPLIVVLRLLNNVTVLVNFGAQVITLLFVNFGIVSTLLFRDSFNSRARVAVFVGGVTVTNKFLLLFTRKTKTCSISGRGCC